MVKSFKKVVKSFKTPITIFIATCVVALLISVARNIFLPLFGAIFGVNIASLFVYINYSPLMYGRFVEILFTVLFTGFFGIIIVAILAKFKKQKQQGKEIKRIEIAENKQNLDIKFSKIEENKEESNIEDMLEEMEKLLLNK